MGWGFGLAAMIVVPPVHEGGGEEGAPRNGLVERCVTSAESGVAGRLAKVARPGSVDPGGSRFRGGRW